MPPPLSRRDLLAGRPPAPEEEGHWLRVYRRAMACRFEVALASDDAQWLDAAREALDEADRVEAVLTVFRDDSEVAVVNRDAARSAVPVSDLLFDLLVRCRRLHGSSGGAFDPTSGPLTRAWGFLVREGRVPPPEEIAQTMTQVGMDRVVLDPDARTVRFRGDGVSLNFGAIGKGLALDRMAAVLRGHGVPRALVSAGGSSAIAVGGPAFQVDVRSPRVAAVLDRVWLADAALGTSGAGEQFFEAQGRRYGHVIDPRTGWPAEGVLSATAACAEAASADALSTAFLIGGPALAERYCAEHPGTLALLTLEAEPSPRLRFGSCAGLTLA